MSPTLKLPSFLIIDCETRGLQGESFALGWVEFTHGVESAAGYLACDPEKARAEGDEKALQFVADHVVPALRGDYLAEGPQAIREFFWHGLWLPAKKRKLPIWADAAWPCEANFIRDCVRDDPTRGFDGPYPLHEVMTVQGVAKWLGMGKSLVGRTHELKTLPAHHPTADARQSGLQVIEALLYIQSQTRVRPAGGP